MARKKLRMRLLVEYLTLERRDHHGLLIYDRSRNWTGIYPHGHSSFNRVPNGGC